MQERRGKVLRACLPVLPVHAGVSNRLVPFLVAAVVVQPPPVIRGSQLPGSPDDCAQPARKEFTLSLHLGIFTLFLSINLFFVLVVYPFQLHFC